MQQIVDTLCASYGYEIYRVYNEFFEPISLRSMYYHLKRGVQLDEFKEVAVKETKGSYTWGDISIRKYYILGTAAQHHTNEDLEELIERLGIKKRDPNSI